MKNVFVTATLAMTLFLVVSCNDDSQVRPSTHTHRDGSTHADHDTVKPKQEEFFAADTT